MYHHWSARTDAHVVPVFLEGRVLLSGQFAVTSIPSKILEHNVASDLMIYDYQIFLGGKPLSGLCQPKLFYLNFQKHWGHCVGRQTQWRDFLSCQISSSQLLKACRDGASTTSDGNEFQLSMTLKTKILWHRLVQHPSSWTTKRIINSILRDKAASVCNFVGGAWNLGAR